MQINALTLELLKAAPFEGTLSPTIGSGRQLFEDVLRDLHGTPGPEARATAPSTTAPAVAARHTVQAGDNLSRICKQYLLDQGVSPSARDINTAVQKVAEANALHDKNLIMPGQELTLDVLASSAPVAPVVATEPVAAETAVAATAPPVTPEPMAEVEAPLLPVVEVPRNAVTERPALTPPAESVEMAAAVRALAALQPNISLWNPSVVGDDAGDDMMSEFQAFQPTSLDEIAAMGPFMAPEEAAKPLTDSALELERVLSMMDSLTEKHKDALAGLDALSPWSQVLGKPAHLTSEFGMRRDPLSGRWQQHDGIDLAAAKGSQVYPYKSGEVVFSGWQSGYGKVVIVRHDDGLESVYGHNSQVLVQAGERVTEKTPLSLVGSTGRSTGPHLHFEVRRDGQAVDPIPYLAPPNVKYAEVQ